MPIYETGGWVLSLGMLKTIYQAALLTELICWVIIKHVEYSHSVKQAASK